MFLEDLVKAANDLFANFWLVVNRATPLYSDSRLDHCWCQSDFDIAVNMIALRL